MAPHPAPSATLHVPKKVEDALLVQWRVVYGNGIEQDCERGGLVYKDGTINPGHFVFDPAATLSPESAIVAGEPGAGARVGRHDEVAAGWDSTEVVRDDPATYMHASKVFGHFHIHPDFHRNFRGCQHNASVPSFGDVGAWLTYHGNMPRALILTSDTSWFLYKWLMEGHGKDGFHCPDADIRPFITKFTQELHRPITDGVDDLLALRRHGFFVYRRWLGLRRPDGSAVYKVWPDGGSATPATAEPPMQADDSEDEELRQALLLSMQADADGPKTATYSASPLDTARAPVACDQAPRHLDRVCKDTVSPRADSPSITLDELAVAQLLSLGIAENAARRACSNTQNAGAEIAAAWYFEHCDDVDINDPLPNVGG